MTLFIFKTWSLAHDINLSNTIPNISSMLRNN